MKTAIPTLVIAISMALPTLLAADALARAKDKGRVTIIYQKETKAAREQARKDLETRTKPCLP
jgi:hypothetical protein